MGKLQCSGSSGGSSSGSVQGLATVPVTARVALLDRPLPEAQEQTGSGNRNRNRSWKPKTGLDWAGLDGTGQDRTGQATARARFDRSSTHWPRDKRARVLARLWI